MSSVFKGKSNKSKADPDQMSGPTIRVEETPHDLSREPLLRLNKKERLQNLSPIPSSHNRAASRGPSERGNTQKYVPVLDTTATNTNNGDKNRSVEIKNSRGEATKPANRRMRSVDRASEETRVEAGDQPTTPRDSNRQVQAMRTIGGGVFRENVQRLDKGKGRDNQAEELGGAEGLEPLAAVLGHPCQDYNAETPEADNREISRNKYPGSGGPYAPDHAHARVSRQDVASQFHGAHNFTIGGNPHFENNRIKNEYYYANQAGTYDIPTLKEFVSFKALYNSSAQDPTRRIHPGTRQRVLKRIQDWINTPSAKERIFWLHGPAGVGKSAIAQTIARSCTKGQLAATFFFYRSDPSRNDGNRLFTTLAWQFAHSIPATKNALIRTLSECPDIPMTDVETQFEELIVRPFLELRRSGVQLSAPIVIIDGVDECSDDGLQRRFLKIIGNAVRDDRVPLRFLICSRPEAHIQDTIDIYRSVTLPLDLARLDGANNDIEKYLRAEFSRIATEQDLDPSWPGEDIIQEFVYKASGQFIYASTVIKYVGDEYSSAETQLDIIRGLKSPSSVSPFADLDGLYKEILSMQRDPVFVKDFLSLLIFRNETEVDNLQEDDAMLLDVSEKELHRKLRGMRSLLRFDLYIDVHHRSFLDFLQDSSRSCQYHISKEAGARRYLDLIAGALVRYASAVIEGYDDHETHFCPQFHKLTGFYPSGIVLPEEEWQQALQPLVDLQDRLLSLPNFHCTWEFIRCEGCVGFRIIRDLLLHLAFLLGVSDRVNSASMPKSHADGSEEMHRGVIPLIPTASDTNALEKDLNACLSSLLLRLRRRKLGISLGTDTIQLLCSLLHFDHTEIAMRLRSSLDAQNLVDLIDELINNKHICSQDISRKAVQLALAIYVRVPILPRSLFSKETVGLHHDVWLAFGGSGDMTTTADFLFQTAFMSKIIDPKYIVRVSWVYEKHTQLLSMVRKVNENKEPLSQWRKRLKPDSVTRIRVMLEVAKALRYFHSMGIVLHHYVNSDDIFLDSKFRPKFRFLGLIEHYVNTIPEWYLTHDQRFHEDNIFYFGCLFYEICFDVKTRHWNGPRRDIVTTRPSKPKIRDDEWQLIEQCCAQEPKNRPTIDEVVREMEAWDIS